MRRRDLEHLIRAAADIADDDEIIVIGSQSILGQYPDAPAALCVSMEADVFPKNRPERWDLIDGTIGEGSPFHATYGYYAQGVSEDTAVLASDWKTRLVPICNANTRQAVGLCLEPHDLVLSKYVAGREKDFVFNSAAFAAGLVKPKILLDRLDTLVLDAVRKDLIGARIRADVRA